MADADRRQRGCFHYRGRRRYRVYRRPNGCWYADYTENHKRKRVSLDATTKDEAEKAVRRLDEGPASGAEHQKTRDVTLVGLRNMYIEHKMRDKAPRTVAKYRAGMAALLRHCKKLGMVLAGELTLPVLEAFEVYRAGDEGCALKTVYTDSNIIKNFLKYASHPARGLMEQNPGEYWEVREPPEKLAYCYTEEEVQKLMTKCREWLRPILTTLAYTGMRIGELINLRWQDVDFKNGMITIAVREDWHPKGRRSRSVPMHPFVRSAVEVRRVGEYVFMGPKGGRIKQNRTLECLKKDREKLGIHHGVLHSFRHFFVSFCAERGVPVLTCMAWVGHKDAEMVWHYYHLHDRASKEAMERLAAPEEVGTLLAQSHSGKKKAGQVGTILAQSGAQRDEGKRKKAVR